MPKTPFEQETIIARRVLNVLGSNEKVAVEIGRPYPIDDGRNYMCPHRITYNSYERHCRTGGVDAVQALQLALKIIAVDLRYDEDLPISAMYWFKPGDDMGFPDVDLLK